MNEWMNECIGQHMHSVAHLDLWLTFRRRDLSHEYLDTETHFYSINQ